MPVFSRGSIFDKYDMPEVTSPVLGDCKNTRNYNSFFSSPDQIWTPTSYSGGDSLSSISDLFAFNKPQSSTMAGWQSVPNYSTPITQYKAQERLADLRLNASHLSYLADRNISNMTDFRSVNQNEDSGDVRNKHFQRPKLDLSFTSYGYQTPQQYRSSPTYSDGSDPLISHHFMERSKPNTPDESDISISPETVADLKNRINIIPYGSSPLTEHNLVNMERISNEKLSAGDNVHQTHNLLSSLYTNQNWNHPRYGSPIASQSPVYEKKSPPWSSTKSKNDNYSNQIENRSLNRNSYNGLHIDPTFTWSGQLPKVVHSIPNYSCKIFLGGVPWDITEDGLIIAFSQFGPVKIEWPGTSSNISQPKGYVYVIMQSDQMVKQLLESCTRASDGGNYYFKISSRKMKNKEVQVIPWIINDSNYYVKHPSQKLDPTQTVFVGALHGMITAQGLFKIMDDLFGNVSYAGIDTDKHKYPMGSSRVTFSSYQSYTKAVAASFIEVKTPKFCKKIEINPYLEDSACSVCNIQLGPYFCKDQLCYRYYCRGCWNWKHTSTLLSAHRPLMRNSKHTPTSISSPPTFTSPNRNSFSPMRNQFEIEQ